MSIVSASGFLAASENKTTQQTIVASRCHAISVLFQVVFNTI